MYRLTCGFPIVVWLVVAGAAWGVTLDGVIDVDYGAALATDPSGDLASPGPADWQGVAWTDLTAIHVTNDANNLYVFISSPALDLDASLGDASAGSFGLAIDVNNSAAGGSTDGWGSAITYGQASLPDYVIRGNVDSGQWVELHAWDSGGSVWTGFATNWGDFGGVSPKIAFGDDAGIEIVIPLADLGGIGVGDTVNLLAFAQQSSGSKGAYDTVPSDDQSTGWDDATTQTNYVGYTLVPEPASLVLLGVGGLVMVYRRRA